MTINYSATAVGKFLRNESGYEMTDSPILQFDLLRSISSRISIPGSGIHRIGVCPICFEVVVGPTFLEASDRPGLRVSMTGTFCYACAEVEKQFPRLFEIIARMSGGIFAAAVEKAKADIFAKILEGKPA